MLDSSISYSGTFHDPKTYNQILRNQPADRAGVVDASVAKQPSFFKPWQTILCENWVCYHDAEVHNGSCIDVPVVRKVTAFTKGTGLSREAR